MKIPTRRLRGFPLCGLSNLLFRHAVKGLCHGGIEPYGSVGEPLEQDFQSLRFAVSPGVHVREHLRESIPSPVPFSVILVFVEQKGFLEPVQDGGDLLHQQSGLFLELLEAVLNLNPLPLHSIRIR